MTNSTRFEIIGGKPLRGEVVIGGLKNAVFPLLAASLLTSEDCTFHNVPRIEDVNRMLELLKTMGAEFSWSNTHTLTVNTAKIDPTRLDQKIVSQLRGSVLLIGPLLARFKTLRITQPGGCKIGARSLDAHLSALAALGGEVSLETDTSTDPLGGRVYYNITGKNLKPAEVTLDEFSVTATENALLLAAAIPGRSTIRLGAAEPHVEELCDVLTKMGAHIVGGGSHTLTVHGKEKLGSINHTIAADYVEAGTFIIAAGATRGRVKILAVNLKHLTIIIKKLRAFNLIIETEEGRGRNNDSIIIRPTGHLIATKIQTMPYPGFPTDLQAPVGVLATQAEGTTLIHDTLYEGRLKYLDELKKMGANAVIVDPHRALITGPTPLYGKDIESFDIRAGATLIIAGLIASGKTTITNAYQVDRGYERIEERFKALGADIKRIWSKVKS